jgi:hypothetical protein
LQKLKRLTGCWAFPGFLLVALGVVFALIHFLEAADFVMEWKEKPIVRWILETADTPAGFMSVLVLGFIWLATLVSHDSSGEESSQDAAPSPAARASLNKSSDPAPNIVVLDTHLLAVELDDDFAVYPSADGLVVAAVIKFRNDAVKGRNTGVSIQTRAHLDITAGGQRLHIDGHWLGGNINRADFMVGDSRELVIAVLRGNDTVLLDDTREAYSGRIALMGLRSADAEIRVKLVGGLDTHHVEEFEFTLRCGAKFGLTQR